MMDLLIIKHIAGENVKFLILLLSYLLFIQPSQHTLFIDSLIIIINSNGIYLWRVALSVFFLRALFGATRNPLYTRMASLNRSRKSDLALSVRKTFGYSFTPGWTHFNLCPVGPRTTDFKVRK